ncbi:hypothetical protein EB75_05560 [Mycobacterium sp. ST-F2]|nr:hypothetical protein EB75_05560 [Mycobacterium sp. ST-F2]
MGFTMDPMEPCYLVEWYSPSFIDGALAQAADALSATAASLSTDGARVRMSTLIAVPTDEVVFGIFVADSAEIVTRTCESAGFPAQRLSAANDVGTRE